MKDSHVQVILEDINHNLQAIREGVDDIPVVKEKVVNLEKKVESIQEDIAIIKMSFQNKADNVRVEKIEKVLHIK